MNARAADALALEGVLATCFGAILDDLKGDEFTNHLDRDAGLKVLAETFLMWRKSMTKK